MKILSSLALTSLAALALTSCQTTGGSSADDSFTWNDPYPDFDSDTAPVEIGSYVPGPGENKSDYPSYQPQQTYNPPSYTAPAAYTPPSYGSSVPRYAGVEDAYSHPVASSYTVAPGDTLFAISRRHNVTVPQLMDANNLTTDLIRVGDILAIPQG